MNAIKIKIVYALRLQLMPLGIFDVFQLIGARESLTMTTLALEELVDSRLLAGTFANGVMKFSLR